mmetsp:Transcript_29275/g.80417  ORF Transcript_29275/g.80417 Transcript_29275/m.80417 type:complete len:551 (-) Transcript_29275:1026-2678(-)
MYKEGTDQQRQRWRQLLFSVTPSSLSTNQQDEYDLEQPTDHHHHHHHTSSSSLTLDTLPQPMPTKTATTSSSSSKNLSEHTSNTSAATSLNLSDLMMDDDDDDNDSLGLGLSMVNNLNQSSNHNDDSGFFVLSQSSSTESMHDYAQQQAREQERQSTAAQYFEQVLQRHYWQRLGGNGGGGNDGGLLLGGGKSRAEPTDPTNKSKKTTKKKKSKDTTPKGRQKKKKTKKNKDTSSTKGDYDATSPHTSKHLSSSSIGFDTPDTVPTSSSSHATGISNDNNNSHGDIDDGQPPTPSLQPPNWQQLQHISVLLSSSDEERGKRLRRRTQQTRRNDQKWRSRSRERTNREQQQQEEESPQTKPTQGGPQASSTIVTHQTIRTQHVGSFTRHYRQRSDCESNLGQGQLLHRRSRQGLAPARQEEQQQQQEQRQEGTSSSTIGASLCRLRTILRHWNPKPQQGGARFPRRPLLVGPQKEELCRRRRRIAVGSGPTSPVGFEASATQFVGPQVRTGHSRFDLGTGHFVAVSTPTYHYRARRGIRNHGRQYGAVQHQ